MKYVTKHVHEFSTEEDSLGGFSEFGSRNSL